MRGRRAYLFGVGLALPLLALVAGLQVPSLTASPQIATTDVNRSLKGDRLPVFVPATNANPSELPHKRTVLSQPALAMRLSSGAKDADVTTPVWPCRTPSGLPSRASHKRSVLSQLAVMMRSPRGEKAKPAGEWQQWKAGP